MLVKLMEMGPMLIPSNATTTSRRKALAVIRQFHILLIGDMCGYCSRLGNLRNSSSYKAIEINQARSPT